MSQRQHHLPVIPDRRRMLYGYHDALREFDCCLFAEAFVGCREGNSGPCWRVKEALCEP